MTDSAKAVFKKYVELSKPGITRMVIITAAFGYLFALRERFIHDAPIDWVAFALCLLGIGLTSAGSSVLNNFMERESDAQMQRTCKRVLPTGAVSANHALAFGLVLIFSGLSILILMDRLLAAFLVLLAAFLYIVVYTPMKKRHWLNTTIGAIPGAMPMAAGWVAATNSMDFGAWVMFAILFAWQHPHFYAIAWMYKDDYAKAGFKMLPCVDPTGARVFIQVILYTFLMLFASVVPVLIGIAGFIYLGGALLLGALMFYGAFVFVKQHDTQSARLLLRTSLIYLPLLLVVAAIDVSVLN